MLCNCRGPENNHIMRHSSIHYHSQFWLLNTFYLLNKLFVYLECVGWDVYYKKSRSIFSNFGSTSFCIKKEENCRPPNKCLHWNTNVNITHTYPSADEIHSLRVRAFSMVSAVVKVFETITTAIIIRNIKTCKINLHAYVSTIHMIQWYLPRVVSGFNPVIFLATSIGSTFARLQID